ncbi:MAG: hypothetical protein JWN76_1111 [Chitinophagaceae bacterium]|nr:hypothetical protein [Chitinophagaceae bacterium]
MNTRKSVQSFKDFLRLTDWRLLVFLLLVMNVKLVVKLVAILFIYLIRPNFHFGLKNSGSRLPLFYIAAPAIALFNFFIYRELWNIPYSVALIIAIGYCLIAFAVIHQLKLATEINSPLVISNTLILFFIINAAVSFLTLSRIMIETGNFNPYRYQGEFQKYFISTGDYIKGISFDTSTTNALINAAGVIYFLNKKNIAMLLLCMATLLLTTSNFTNLAVMAILFFTFLFNSDKLQKSLIIICIAFFAFFMAQVSPQNNKYLNTTIARLMGKEVPKEKWVRPVPVTEKPDSILTAEEKKEKFAQFYIDSMALQLANKPPRTNKNETVVRDLTTGVLVIPEPSIHSAPFQHKRDTTTEQKKLIGFIEENKNLVAPDTIELVKEQKLGKLLSAKQSVDFMSHHPYQLAAGTGAGNFSSKLAFKTAALGITGNYPSSLKYINSNFEKNHLSLYLSVFINDTGLHSVFNTPNSAYDQLLTEYGIIGLALFAFFYFGFFMRSKLSYGWQILALLAAALFIEYWFEQLSVLILFELLLFLNIKEKDTKEEWKKK